MIKKVLLTGASGVVGSEISVYLQSRGFYVYEMRRTLLKERENDFFYQIKLDIQKDDWNFLYENIDEIDYVIHFAASLKLGVTSEEKEELELINVSFTKFILDFCITKKVSKFIFASTLSFIKRPLPQIIKENSELNAKLYYSETKLKSENMILDCFKNNGLNFSIFRISSPVVFNLNKMHDNFLKKWLLLAKNKNSLELHGEGERSQDFVYVKDIAHAVFLSISNINKNGIYNISSGSTITVKEILDLIINKFDVNYSKITTSEPEEQWNISIEKAQNELGYFPQFSSIELVRQLINKC
jgi:UDP-glucose 4-epimerase